MRAAFSEFSFGYAVVEELAAHQQGINRVMPPHFPTLRQEKLMGYDVKVRLLSAWVYLQFTICEVLVRKTAKEIADMHLPLTIPFLRMKLMPSKRSPQHQLLLNLEQEGERVFYPDYSWEKLIMAFGPTFSCRGIPVSPESLSRRRNWHKVGIIGHVIDPSGARAAVNRRQSDCAVRITHRFGCLHGPDSSAGDYPGAQDTRASLFHSHFQLISR